ncbi:aminotransferase A [Anoxybacillus rupiensis]|jgi:aminotransferase|uniref:Aminotransferase n=1 Tax=Anoxybacteroides rupiense TaxID=311460 RepID=A0ABD5IPV2_9BACL|nr:MULTISPECIES: aminotransferase A [Anoxybacillus]KXG10360.1 putative N-acetyl-LL-diaminopimelate aminotransferase [Anoxybacillus sp. P3H1B]MBS2770661.1 aminotransferase A [Anoxybacillus rupiensis]MDE8564378.1 aminotransferase A [Anoxybacillus rupiensis]MED5050302.1 aminotransferase A [Anoxybacillus rupiensis]OQM46398.1 aromatic amino acid aminotransferase [Anoxybacillus sp. UARK-01]
MEHLIHPRIKNIEISGIRKFFNMVADRPNLISLTIGQPDFPTPEHVKEAGKQAISDNFTVYTHNAGLLEVRQAACRFVNEKYGLHYNENEVIVTIGASQAIDIAFRTILEEGVEVILPGPVYPGYEPIIRMCGAKPVYVDTRHNQFRLSADLIKPYINERTRCIVLPYPSNPTGVTLAQQDLLELAELLKDRPIWILSDEIYSELVYSGKHASIAKWLRNQTIVINGLSKSHSMTGWRVGFVFAPEFLTKHLIKVHQYSVSCASSISQKAALAALTAGKEDANDMRKLYEQRMEYAYSRLVDMGFQVEKPTGAFYLFPSIEPFHTSSFEFALDLVDKAGVAVVPGSAFSAYGEGYVRLSYAYSLETLAEGLNRIEQYVQKHKR